LAVTRRRESRREEAREQEMLAGMLAKYLPSDAFFSGVENRPFSCLAGFLQKRRGIRAGLPDLLILYRGKLICIELKSRRGALSKVQRQVRLELVKAGASVWLCRTARAGLAALVYSGVPLKRKWTLPRLKEWEGPSPTQHLPLPPEVVTERREAKRRWRERQRVRDAAGRAAAALGAQTPVGPLQAAARETAS
jgi:hypothetical protein